MKRIAVAAVLALAAQFAHAAPPTGAQVDALLQAMDAPTAMEGILTQMTESSRQMGTALLGPDATPAQRAAFDRVMRQQEAVMQEALRWDTLAPVYRRVYAETFTAAEIEAMTRFYASPEGRSIMAKLPQAMGRTMQELQPMMQRLMEQVQASLRQELATPPAR